MDADRLCHVVVLVGLWLMLAAGCAVPPGSERGAGTAPAATAATPAPGACRRALLRNRRPPSPTSSPRAGEQLLREAQAVVGGGAARAGHRPPDRRQHRPADRGYGADRAAAERARREPGAALERATVDAGQPVERPLLHRHAHGDQHRPDVGQNANALRICLVLIDLRTGKLVAKRVDRATLAKCRRRADAVVPRQPDVGLRPDDVAYIKSCQGSSPGDDVDPRYLLRLPARRSSTRRAYRLRRNKPAEAYRLLPRGPAARRRRDLRVLNGLYLTSWKTGRKKEAADTFGKIVGIGLDTQEAADQAVLQPGHDDVARNRPTCRPSTRSGCTRSRPRSAARDLPAASSATPAAPATPPPTSAVAAARRCHQAALERLNRSLDARVSSPMASARAR